MPGFVSLCERFPGADLSGPSWELVLGIVPGNESNAKFEITNHDKEVETMLALSRKIGESIQIGTHVTITIHKLSKTRVSLTIEAPEDIRILRSELIFDVALQSGMGRVVPFVDET